MKKYLTVIFLLFFIINCKESFANVGLPGFFNVGTGRTLIPSFAKEIKYAEKISMQSEIIKINLYKGFAVIKGEYNMFNSSDKEITVNVGYPENGIFINKAVSNVIYNQIDNLQVYVENKKVKTESLESDIPEEVKYNKWYIWKATFLPKKLTKIIVYYMVDTHSANLHFGYDRDYDNGLAYIVESGKLWQGKIGDGSIYVKLMDDLNKNDLIGLFPKELLYSESDNTIIYKFSNLEPTENNNILVRYKNKVKDFNYDLIRKDFSNYYKTLDNIPLPNTGNNTKELDKNNFKVFPYTMTVILAVLFFILVIIILSIYSIIRLIIKYLKKRKDN